MGDPRCKLPLKNIKNNKVLKHHALHISKTQDKHRIGPPHGPLVDMAPFANTDPTRNPPLPAGFLDPPAPGDPSLSSLARSFAAGADLDMIHVSKLATSTPTDIILYCEHCTWFSCEDPKNMILDARSISTPYESQPILSRDGLRKDPKLTGTLYRNQAVRTKQASTQLR